MDPAYIISIAANGFVALTVASLGGYYSYKLKKRDQRDEEVEQSRDIQDKAIRDGVCALLRDRLLQTCVHFEQLHYIPPRELDSLSKMYNAYHALGGNDIITGLYAEMIDLPHSEEAAR